MRIALTALTARGPQDIVVSGGENATVGQVAALVRAALDGGEPLAPVISLSRAGPAPQTLWLGGRQADPRAPAARVLTDGAVVATDPRAAPATATASGAEPSGVVEIRVVSGVTAGIVHRMGLGAVTLGASQACDVRVGGPGVRACAARLVITPGRQGASVMLEPPQGPREGAPLLLDGEPVPEPRPWRPGVPLKIGPNVLTVHPPEPPDAHLSPADDGGLAYNRPPRLRPPEHPRRIEVPAEPRRGDRIRPQLFAALIPVVLGAVMAKLLHQWMYLLFMIMSPVMMLGQWMSDRRHGRASYARAMKQYRRRWAELDGVIAAERAAEEAQLRRAAPDPAQILLTATGPRRRLWERRTDDDDVLRLRVGLADQPSRIEFVLDKRADYDADVPAVPGIHDVPVTLPLPELGVIGLAGPRDPSRALARWMVAQAAALHSPRDLSIVVLAADPQAGAQWNWVRWLPHCAPRQGEDCVALVGADQETAARRVSELAARAGERIKEVSEAGQLTAATRTGGPGPKILVVLDGAGALRRIPGMPQVLSTSRMTGIHAICIDDTDRQLPEECAAVLSWDARYFGWVRMRGTGLDLPEVALADQVSISWSDRLARALAPIRDVSRDDGDAMIPSAARLLEVIGMPDPARDQIIGRWRRLGRTIAVPVGVGADGPFTVDLRADGPHALVAGTTGAGKSELLQTLIASLAVANRPDAMTFVLIDYKGGSAFKDCARLPHTVGMVSDLDGHLTERALASLSAELKRREEILLHAGAKDIEDYWDVQRADARLAPLPRLVLIIDEFASLVAELPDFVTGLVGIAQRGRSLGVHLILATQRPAGVVSADIRANTNLRIALRVTDSAESLDVIDVPDAARIAKATPGRCYVRSGASVPVAVQSARIGGRRHGGAGPGEAGPQVTAVPWRALGRPLRPAGPTVPADDATMATDLSVLVDAIAAAARSLGLSEQRSPWLPPLPELVTLGTLPPAGVSGDADVAPVPFGITDIPARQAREPLSVDLANGGHLVIAGAPRSGRSTALRTIAGSVAASCSPADVHIYGLDCGTGSLLPLSGLPHCGAVVTRDQTDRVERLLATLRAEISRRQQLLAARGFAGVAEQRARCADPGQKLPWMLLLLDWWEGYVAAYEQYDFGRLIDTMLLLLREGPAVGMRAVVTTDRTALIGQVGTVFQRRMVLNLADKDDASYAGLNVRAMPAHQPPGRLMFLGGTHTLEAQVALLDPDPSGTAQVAAIHALAAQATARYDPPSRTQRPLRVDALPPRTTIAESLALDPAFSRPSPLWALIGSGGDELGPQGVDIGAEGPGIVVAGPPRTGRSTALLTMTTSLLSAGTPVLLITPRRSPLRSLSGRPGVLGVLGSDVDSGQISGALAGQDRYVVVVDDAELLADSLVSPALEEILVSGRDAEHGMILAGSTGDLGRLYSGFVPMALKSRCGVFVALEGPGDGDLFGIRLPRGVGPGPLGRGLLVRPGATAPIQIALPE